MSLASAIVQFIDFGFKLVSEGIELYENGTLTENEELELITSDLENLANNLGTSSSQLKTNSPDEKALQELAFRCNDLAIELLAILDTLKPQRQGSTKLRHGLESVRVAVRNARKKGRIQTIESRLEKLQKQLNSRMISILSLLDIEREIRRSDTNINSRIDSLRAELLRVIPSTPTYNHDTSQDTVKLITQQCQKLVEEGQRVATSAEILQSLHFSSIRSRESSIKDAHRHTFEWVYNDHTNPGSETQFVNWLRHGDGLFWYNGKAGSGKSTLMKYLCGNERTRDNLKFWTGEERKLVIASYFFWSGGNSMQKSQQGLLQSLLYQILKQDPDLIPKVCASRWRSSDDHSLEINSWTLRDLSETFQYLSSDENSSSARFCFFIDGLDEYDTHDGEHTELIDVLRSLSRNPHIKLCVSSRPWNVFQKAFGNKAIPQLILQDYTKRDIELYVKNKLEEDIRFLDLKDRDPRHHELTTGIVNKANGVFLWVFYVVRSLLRGLTDDNDISTLLDRLDHLPSDLEGYFRQMLTSIEDVYQAEMAQIIQINVLAVQPLSVVAFSSLGDIMKDPNFALTLKPQSLSAEEVGLTINKMKTHLNARCRDLLEVYVDPEEIDLLQTKVTFLHRSARDFLMMKEIQELLRSQAPANFDARTTLCKLYLTQIKTLPLGTRNQRTSSSMSLMVREMLYYAYEVEIHNGVSEVQLLDELYASLLKRRADMKALWGRLHGFPAPKVPQFLESLDLKWFAIMVVQKRLVLYLQHLLQREPLLIKSTANQSAILHKALSSVATPHAPSVDPMSDLTVSIVSILLDAGCDPNGKRPSNSTIWTTFLVRVSHTRPDMEEQLFDIARLMLEHGADPDCMIEVGHTTFEHAERAKERRQPAVKTGHIRKMSAGDLLVEVFKDNPHFQEEIRAVIKKNRRRDWSIWSLIGWR
ncbi:Vegetative incompatibility HET-E-1 protein [Rutstroemia sp. NJR-2017a BVV2]|nr:Vegetative incompatibility HET-E-1 protein [Rutstroemia sp. NJR-2017a BVV2]